MKNILINLIRSAAMAALITGTATLALGAEKADGNSANAAAAPAENARTYPFRGTVGTADPAANTVSLAGKTSRLVHLNATSKLSRDGKDISLAGVHTGDYLKGLVLKSDGQETIIKASVGEKPEPKPRAAKSQRTKSPRRSSKASMKGDTAGN